MSTTNALIAFPISKTASLHAEEQSADLRLVSTPEIKLRELETKLTSIHRNVTMLAELVDHHSSFRRSYAPPSRIGGGKTKSVQNLAGLQLVPKPA